MITKKFALILTILTLGIGATMALAESSKDSPSLVLISATKVFAEQGRGQPSTTDRSEQFQELLKLSDQQMQELSSIRQKYSPQIEELGEKMKITGQELSQMMQGNASENDLRSKHQEMLNLNQQMRNLRFESMLEMRKVLTPEQRQQFAQLVRQRGQRGWRNRPNTEEMP